MHFSLKTVRNTAGKRHSRSLSSFLLVFMPVMAALLLTACPPPTVPTVDDNGGGDNVTVEKAPNPTFTPPEGNLPGKTTRLTISASKEGMSFPIHYTSTTDGATDPPAPTADSPQFPAGGVDILTSTGENYWIKAVAIQEGYTNSDVVLAKYSRDDSAAASPMIDLAAGKYVGQQTLTITVNDGSTIYYTFSDDIDTDPGVPATDGSGSTEYIGPIAILTSNDSEYWIKAIAIQTGFTASPPVSRKYSRDDRGNNVTGTATLIVERLIGNAENGYAVQPVAGETAALTVDLSATTPIIGSGGSFNDDAFVTIRNIAGGNGVNTFTGDSGANIFTGGTANDVFNGGGGDDTLNGQGGNDTLNGDAGDDTFNGGAGNDELDGGTGDDTAVYNTQSGGVAFTVADNGSTYTVTGGSENGEDTLTDIGTIRLSAGADTIGNVDDTPITGIDIDGAAGTDTIRLANGGITFDLSSATNYKNFETITGGSDADTITGSSANETINGGDGFDTALYTASAKAFKITGDVVAGYTVNGNLEHGTDTLRTIERIQLSTGDDTIENVSSIIVDILIDGAGGTDTIRLADGSNVTFNLSNAVNYMRFETITGGTGVDTITGTDGAETINGGGGVAVTDFLNGLGGDDTLNGGTGDDILTGGTGNDTLTGNAGNDTAAYVSSSEVFKITGGNGDYTVNGNSENGTDTLSTIETIRLSAENDTVGDVATTLQPTSGVGSITIDGMGGTNTINLRDGNLTVDLSNYKKFAVINAGTGDHNITGTEDDNTITAGAGNDTVNGGGGTNTAVYPASATFTITASGSSYTVAEGTNGTDTLSNIASIQLSDENDTVGGVAATLLPLNGITIDGRGGTNTITLSDGDHTIDLSNYKKFGAINTGTGAYNITGTEDDNTITATADAMGDEIDGGAGDDTIHAGAGNDTLDGGAGSDTVQYLASATGFTVTDNGNGRYTVNGGTENGTDTLSTIETIRLSDVANRDSDNNLIGDTVSGVLGSESNDPNDRDRIMDIIIDAGGGGADTLVLANGSDVAFNLSLSTNYVNFENISGKSGEDHIIGTSAQNTLRGGGADDVLESRDGDDTLYGGGGNDELHGENGRDEFYGGPGTDDLHGGPGNDNLSGGTPKGDDDGAIDTFHFGLNAGTDRILDFVVGSDTLNFTAIPTIIESKDFVASSDGGKLKITHDSTTDTNDVAIIFDNIAVTNNAEAESKFKDITEVTGSSAIVY